MSSRTWAHSDLGRERGCVSSRKKSIVPLQESWSMSLEEISTDDAFCLTDEDPGVQRANEDNPFSGMQIRH